LLGAKAVSMAALETWTLADLESQDLDPDAALFARRLLVSTYEQFVEVLYTDIDKCLKYMEETRNDRQEDSEDHRTIDIIGWLRALGYRAGHDEMVGGHSDIVVRHRKGWMWLGEAKIHSSYDYLMQGFQQLCTRYAPGTTGASEGGLLIYVKGKNAASVVEEWRSRLKAHALADYEEKECEALPGLAFYSTHKHAESGLTMRVRHVGIVQGWDPQDRREVKKTDTPAASQ
jgi:hypothetical protein